MAIALCLSSCLHSQNKQKENMLQQNLDALKTQIYQRMPEVDTENFDKQIKELKDANFAEKGLQVGDKIPNVILPNAKGEQVNLNKILEDNFIVISFYRGGWCPYCNLELRTLQQYLPEFEKYNAKLIAISPEKPDNSLSTVEKNQLKFEVLTDINNQEAKKFGIVFEYPKYLEDTFNGFGLDLKKYNNSDKIELPLPATYVVDKEGVIQYAFADEDYTKRANPEEIVDALKKMQ